MRPVTDLERRVAPFKVVSDYQPSGDQPAAIKDIVGRIQGGEQDVVLLGATGTGKTATVAWVAEQRAKEPPAKVCKGEKPGSELPGKLEAIAA